MVQPTRTTVSLPWRTLVKVMMVCSAELMYLIIVVNILILEETGSSLMELEFPAQVTSGTSTEPEVRVWCVYNEGEVEQMECTTVRYLYLNQMQKM